MNNIFEKASRQKLRFEIMYSQGNKVMGSTEDLWGLSDKELDNVAKPIRVALKNDEDSFLSVPNKSQTQNKLRIEILQHIFSFNKEAKERAIERASLREEIEETRKLLKVKEIENTTETKLKAKLKKLEKRAAYEE